MRYYPTYKLYKASNVTFCAETLRATSYGHWCFVRMINGLVVVNTFRYSNTTARHQWKVNNLMGQLGLPVNLYVETECSLDDSTWVLDAIERLERKASNLKDAINAPRSQKAKNAERFKERDACNDKIAELKRLFIDTLPNNVIPMRRV